MSEINRFRRDESGAALAEYGILVALVAVVAVGAVQLLGTQVNRAFTGVTSALAPPAAPQPPGRKVTVTVKTSHTKPQPIIFSVENSHPDPQPNGGITIRDFSVSVKGPDGGGS